MTASTMEEPCCKCRAQLEKKDAIIAKYQKIVQFQTDLIQDFSQGQKFTTTTSNSENELIIAHGKSNRDYYRTYIGPLTDEIDKGLLKQCLEKSFGPVNNIDFIPRKSCAFANFSSPTAYHNAISVGAIMINDIVLSVEQAKKPKHRSFKKSSST